MIFFFLLLPPPDEFQKLGIQCFYHNPYLVDWANVLFLCCLPSQLPNICLEIQTHLEKGCIVYSFVAAVPIARYPVRVSIALVGLLWPLIPGSSPPHPPAPHPLDLVVPGNEVEAASSATDSQPC